MFIFQALNDSLILKKHAHPEESELFPEEKDLKHREAAISLVIGAIDRLTIFHPVRTALRCVISKRTFVATGQHDCADDHE